MEPTYTDCVVRFCDSKKLYAKFSSANSGSSMSLSLVMLYLRRHHYGSIFKGFEAISKWRDYYGDGSEKFSGACWLLTSFSVWSLSNCTDGSGGYWASMRIQSNLMLQIKEAQRDDGELWAIMQNVEDGKHTEFSVDDDGVVKIEHQRASSLLLPLEIPMWKRDEISMDFVTGLPTTQKRHDAIWVVVDRLTKSVFLTIRKNYGL
ncbi:retrotransposon protein, putative, ty3-gypsy subclass [Tanacetum coccineum]